MHMPLLFWYDVQRKTVFLIHETNKDWKASGIFNFHIRKETNSWKNCYNFSQQNNT